MFYDLVEAILASGASMPSPGIALTKLQAAIQDENAGAREFARAVATDPAVCGALIRVANSGVFRPPEEPRASSRQLSVSASRALWQ